MSKGHITVLSCGVGTESLTDKIRQTVAGASLLAGGQRLLDLFPDYAGEKIVIGKRAGETIANLAEIVLKQNREICVLASGDALFYGIGKTFSKLIPADQMTIVPNISSMQAMAAKLCLPWDSVKFFSVHGNKDDTMPLRQMLAANFAIIYADPKCTAANLAALLIKKFPEAAERPAALGEDLGLPAEKVVKGALSEISGKECSGLSILVLMPHSIVSPGLPLGLADDEYAHQENLITHPEIRAVAISKLRLGSGVMWDIGAGSGSVGIEAAGLCRDLAVYSIEKNSERVKDIEANIKKFEVENVCIKSGNALEIIEDLPEPRAVFIGGGGENIGLILEKCFARLLPGGVIAATAVLLETRSSLANSLKDNCLEILSLSVSRAKALGSSRMMKSENNIEMYVYKK